MSNYHLAPADKPQALTPQALRSLRQDPVQGISRRTLLRRSIGGAALQNQTFRFWDASNHRLVDGRGSYGYGIQFSFLGLTLHWDFAHLTDFRKTYSGLKTSFYIGTEF